MLEDLRIASEQLRVALERYLGLCSNIQNTCLQGIAPRDNPAKYAQEVDREHELVDLYDTKMQQAKLAIKITRNHMLSIAPINCLPLEILVRIFHMACSAEPCRVDHLALVCSRWRYVAISSPSLWSHIDYHPHISKWFYPELITQAQLFISRSGETPLEFHLSALSEIYNAHCYERPVKSLCERIAPRMRSLNMNFEGFYQERDDDDTHYLLSILLSKCVQGTLTKLVIVDPSRFGFITATDEHLDDSILAVQLKQERLNRILGPITVLHLTGLFPQWTSHVYHGLVDLRLRAAYTGAGGDNTISESQLIAVLRASPRLRILHFELRVNHQIEIGSSISIPRVQLADLEVLRVQSGYAASFRQVEDFLRLLEPGRKPLHLSIRRHSFSIGSYFPAPETTAFFQRSNITKLYANELPQLLNLLPSLPHLEVLALSDQKYLDSTVPANQHHSDKQTSWPQLNTCFVLNCSIPFNGLLDLARNCNPQALVLFNNQFHLNLPGEWVDTELVEKELSAICADVRVPNTRPSLTTHMELLDDS